MTSTNAEQFNPTVRYRVQQPRSYPDCMDSLKILRDSLELLLGSSRIHQGISNDVHKCRTIRLVREMSVSATSLVLGLHGFFKDSQGFFGIVVLSGRCLFRQAERNTSPPIIPAHPVIIIRSLSAQKKQRHLFFL